MVYFVCVQVLQDDELRALLLDTELQQTLRECGDPAVFQRVMRDPVMAYKIKKLYAAGLVGTAR
jgi:hypothetical protein